MRDDLSIALRLLRNLNASKSKCPTKLLLSYRYMMTSANCNILFWILIISFSKGTQANASFNDVLNLMQVDSILWNQRNPKNVIPRSENVLPCARPDSYTCELPPDYVPSYSTKTCNYRNWDYQEQVYRWVAGRGCLFYTPDFLYVAGYNNISLNVGCSYGPYAAPCLEIPKEDGTCGCYPFDPGFKEVASIVNQALIPSARGRWERCFDAASVCCRDVMKRADEDLDVYCPATFDAWTCWDAAPNDTTQTEVCSDLAYSNMGPTCHHFSTKRCHDDGTWDEQTDYTTCSITPRLLRRYRYHIGVLAFSVASCLPAIFVFFFYKRLRVTRVALHRNLLIAIVLRNILVIVSRSEIYIDELTNSGDTVMSTHSGWCQALAVAERIAANAVFVCMLIEGIYLHRIIVAVFKKHHKVSVLYGVGAVITIAPVLVWSIVMGLYNNHSCWLVYTVDHIQWIVDVPRICILLINTGLFIDILRVLITKIRNAENVNQLSTAKVTLFLMPIFGIQFLLTAFRPTTESCTGEQVYFIVTYTIEGIQGFIVALLFCYINKEVHNLVKGTFKKTEAAVSRVLQESNYRRSTLGKDSDRRLTFSTGLEPAYNSKRDTLTKPNIQVAEVISIQTSERLADILDPKFEAIATSGIVNDGYDSAEGFSNDSGNSGNYPKKDTDEDSTSNFPKATSSSTNSFSPSLSDDSLNEIKPFNRHRFKKYDPNFENVTAILENKKELPNNYKIENEAEIFDPKEAENLGFDTDLFDEIMDYIESKQDDIVLNSEALAPNRKTEDKIVFLDE